jgi:hypothetical protein
MVLGKTNLGQNQRRNNRQTYEKKRGASGLDPALAAQSAKVRSDPI